MKRAASQVAGMEIVLPYSGVRTVKSLSGLYCTSAGGLNQRESIKTVILKHFYIHYNSYQHCDINMFSACCFPNSLQP